MGDPGDDGSSDEDPTVSEASSPLVSCNYRGRARAPLRCNMRRRLLIRPMYMPISAIGARAHLIGLVLLAFGEYKLDFDLM